MAADKTDIWFSMYPGDYLKDTLDLTLEEDAFYSRALNQVYINRGRIPADAGRLQRLLRVTPAQFKRCRHILDRYFFRDGQSYGNQRADIEIAKANQNLEAARENGKKGSEKRWGKNRPPIATPIANPIANPKQNDSSSPSPSDPPSSPPDIFKTRKPELYAAFGITQPSMTDENAMYEFFLEFKTKGATMDELRQRIALYREKCPDYPLTTRAILKNWHSLIPPPKPVPVVDDYVLDAFQEDAA